MSKALLLLKHNTSGKSKLNDGLSKILTVLVDVVLQVIFAPL